MIGRLILLFTVIPLLELWILLQLGHVAGLPATIAVVLATGAVGAAVARIQGLATLQRARTALAAGRLPATEAVDGLLILLAGALLVTPGLLTDLCGLVLLVPRARSLVRARVSAALARRLQYSEPPTIDGEYRRTD